MKHLAIGEMKHLAIGELGRPMVQMDGTLYLPWDIIDDAHCTSTKLKVNALLKQLSFLPTEVVVPFPLKTDLGTKAAKQFTHALLHPKLDGPFKQVRDP
jgi:hypothetical protein